MVEYHSSGGGGAADKKMEDFHSSPLLGRKILSRISSWILPAGFVFGLFMFVAFSDETVLQCLGLYRAEKCC